VSRAGERRSGNGVPETHDLSDLLEDVDERVLAHIVRNIPHCATQVSQRHVSDAMCVALTEYDLAHRRSAQY
jgi:hypothetical protein